MPSCRWFLLICLAAGAAAQPADPKPSAPVVDTAFVQAQFGNTCDLAKGMLPIQSDLNGDGVMDMVIPAHCTNPMMDQAEHDFLVIDPYYTFFGYGDPKVTSQFATEDPSSRSLVLLIIHGSGAEVWHAATPKEKFVVINLPYKGINVKRLAVKKKPVQAIYLQESDSNQTVSVIFWDGKKYKYQPVGSSLE